MYNSFSIKLLFAGLVLLMPSSIPAQDLEPRSYEVFPAGLHAVAFSFTSSKGNVIREGASPLQDK